MGQFSKPKEKASCLFTQLQRSNFKNVNLWTNSRRAPFLFEDRVNGPNQSAPPIWNFDILFQSTMWRWYFKKSGSFKFSCWKLGEGCCVLVPLTRLHSCRSERWPTPQRACASTLTRWSWRRHTTPSRQWKHFLTNDRLLLPNSSFHPIQCTTFGSPCTCLQRVSDCGVFCQLASLASVVFYQQKDPGKRTVDRIQTLPEK